MKDGQDYGGRRQRTKGIIQELRGVYEFLVFLILPIFHIHRCFSVNFSGNTARILNQSFLFRCVADQFIHGRRKNRSDTHILIMVRRDV
jgi:hypothetical protein